MNRECFGFQGIKRLRLSRWFFICLPLIALLLTGAPKPVSSADIALQSVEAVRTGKTSTGARIVFDLQKKADFRAFHMDNPARIAIDFDTARWHAPKSALLNNGGLLKSYRSGVLEDGLTRVIFDLSRPAVITGAFTLPKSDFEKNRIVLDVMPASDNLFKSQQGLVFGNRDLKGSGALAATGGVGFSAMQNNIVRDSAVPDANAATSPLKNGVYQPPGSAKYARKTLNPAPLTLHPIQENVKKYTIVIDAGHGGEDPGAAGCCGITEKFITLQIAKALERALVETGRYRVVLTRGKDVYIKLRERVDISRRVKGDLFVSIHADKISRSNVRGASIYTLSQNASDNETARLAEQENNSGVVAGVDLAQENSDVAGILLDLAMREKMNESKLLSRFLEQSFGNNSVLLLPNSHRAAGFAVLKAPDIPSVLIETGFLSNPEEAKLLSTSAFQARIASAITDGIDAYFRKIQALQKF